MTGNEKLPASEQTQNSSSPTKTPAGGRDPKEPRRYAQLALFEANASNTGWENDTESGEGSLNTNGGRNDEIDAG